MRAGLGTAIILIHTFGGFVAEGFNQGYVNFASRAYGIKNMNLYFHYFIQGLFTIIGVELVVIIIGLLSYQICLITNQEMTISNYTYLFFVYQLPGLIMFYISDFAKSYLSTQQIFLPLLIPNIVGIIGHFIFSYFISGTI
jgi:predicted membrane-bound mannosyltransferase